MKIVLVVVVWVPEHTRAASRNAAMVARKTFVHPTKLNSRLRGNDGVFNQCLSQSSTLALFIQCIGKGV
jgi:hypothetical protein